MFLSPQASAETVLLPDSRDLQYRTYGLFFDEQSTLVYRNGGHAQGALGGTLAILEERDWLWEPQLIIHGSANSAFTLNSRGDTLLTETVDARVGLAMDLRFNESFRGTLIWTHQSGHISDNVPDPDLIGSNLGNEIITLRLIRDFAREWRFGAGLRPSVGSDPGLKVFGAEQFAEWFPWHASEDIHRFSPFVAVGFEEYGRQEIDFTFNGMIGLAAGDHFSESKHPGLRVVLGYYNGADPRLKYFQFKNSKVGFVYGGLMFDI